MGKKAALLAILFSTTCLSAEAAQDKPKSDLDAIKKQIEAQHAKIDSQEKNIQEQLQKVLNQQEELKKQKQDIARLEAMFEKTSGKKVTPTPASQQNSQTAQAPQPAGSDNKSKGDQKIGTDYKPASADRPPEVQTLTDVGGVLTPKGTFILEPSVEYSNSSAVRVALEGYTIIPALNIGLFDVSRVNRDMLIASVGGRYGLTNRIEIDAKVPYVYRDDSTFSRPVGIGAAQDTLTNVSGDGIGDVEVGAHYQINTGQNGWPFFIANARFKSITGTSPYDVPVNSATGLQEELPTGSGFYALQPSITAIYPSDPAVFYANAGYLFNFEKNVGGTYGTIDPGDSVNLSFGMGLSINEKSSINFGYSHDVVMQPKQNGVVIPLTDTLQVGTLDIGYSYRLNPKTSINFNVDTGLTEDSPDLRLILKVPYRFGGSNKK